MERKQVRPTIFLIGCILIILLGAATTFFWKTHSELPARAAGGDVVGPPTLPAATVDSILANMGSPMVGTGAVIEQASRQTNIDDAFALAVWWTETNDGAAGVGIADRNPGSMRGSYGYPAAFDGYTIYASYSAGIIDWFNVVRSRYVDRGLTSAYTICYPYVGTSSSYQWAIKVVNLMIRYHGEAPPPPTPTPTPIPTPDAVRIQHTQVHAVKPKPAVMGLTREVHIRGNVVAPVIARPRTSVNVPAPIVSTPPASPFIILSGLLAALLIALWGMRLGRDIPSYWCYCTANSSLYRARYDTITSIVRQRILTCPCASDGAIILDISGATSTCSCFCTSSGRWIVEELCRCRCVT